MTDLTPINKKPYLIPEPYGYREMPDWLRPLFILKRIDEPELVLTLEQRNAIAEGYLRGDKAVIVGQHLIATFNIKSIDPMYGEDNIPPKPKALPVFKIINAKAQSEKDPRDLKLIEEWEKFYGKKD